MLESALLLFMVMDPFGNLPLVLAVIGDVSRSAYRRIILREVLLAFLILVVFTLAGDQVLAYLGVSQSSLSVAGGVILFIISLKMIFQNSAQIFEDPQLPDPLLVPIAVPALAGPSAITTVMILRGGQQIPAAEILIALSLVSLLTGLVLLLGPGISKVIGLRGIKAIEKLFGLLLCLVAVSMMLEGIRAFLS
jgi:multiple antibiotic resistance protein